MRKSHSILFYFILFFLLLLFMDWGNPITSY